MKLWYEETAMQGMPMPDGLDRIDQRMFLDLRALYWQLRNGVVDGTRRSRTNGVW